MDRDDQWSAGRGGEAAWNPPVRVHEVGTGPQLLDRSGAQCSAECDGGQCPGKAGGRLGHRASICERLAPRRGVAHAAHRNVVKLRITSLSLITWGDHPDLDPARLQRHGKRGEKAARDITAKSRKIVSEKDDPQRLILVFEAMGNAASARR